MPSWSAIGYLVLMPLEIQETVVVLQMIPEKLLPMWLLEILASLSRLAQAGRGNIIELAACLLFASEVNLSSFGRTPC